MKKKTWVFVALTMSFQSCNDVLDFEIADGNREELIKESHLISKEDALNSLRDFFSDNSETGLKSIRASVDTIEMWGVSYRSLVSGNKALCLNADCEDLVYIANFTDEQGYAILAADDRIKEDVLFVADNGSISKNSITSAVTKLNGDRYLFDDYPLNGKGFFSLSEYPGEVFMNPNTVSLYDGNEGDTFVGDFSIDDIGVESFEGSLGSVNKAVQLKTGELEIGIGMCLEYARREVEDKGVEGLSIQSSKSVRTETNLSSWKDLGAKIISNKYVRWDQHAPFNDLYPKRRKFVVLGNRRKAPAGCFPLAVAKVMTHFSYPSVFRVNGYLIDWSALKESNLSDEAFKKSAAALLYGISESCHSIYFYEGTFTFPNRVISYLKGIGLKNVNNYDYKFSRVKEMIDKSYPVIIYAMPKLNVTDSHAWNIDGYKTKTRTKTIKTYNGNVLVNSSIETETREMVHCDFGWGGKSNGYYVSGIFKLYSSENDYDNKNETGKSVYYNNLVKIITYTK